MKSKKILYPIGGLLVLALITVGIFGYSYLSTPTQIRKPAFEHAHARIQIIVDGKAVDFSQSKFQESYDSATCSADISKIPFDFHDNMDQIAHIHWANMTGGEFLKYFGWNLIGGSNEVLGKEYKNGLLSPTNVNIYGKYLPKVSDQDNYYVYVGDANSFKQKDWNDFLHKDLETFLGQKSSLSHSKQASIIKNLFTSKAYAHGEVIDEHAQDDNKSEAELKRINNLLGNIVIFAQEKRPSDKEVKEKFNNLIPLHTSTCGG